MNTLTEKRGPISSANLRHRLAAIATVGFAVLFSTTLTLAQAPAKDTAAGHPAEGKLQSFLGQPKLDPRLCMNVRWALGPDQLRAPPGRSDGPARAR